MSSAPPTQPQVPSQPAPPASSQSGVDLATLIITAIASAVAAYVTSKVWAPGTLASAAFTPVLVALVKEALRRPTQVVTTVVPPVLPRARRHPGPQAAVPSAPQQDVPGADLPQPAIVAVDPPPITYHRTTGRRLRWRVALITGVLGFALCAALYTVPELLTSGKGTTLFGGGGGTQHVTRTIKRESTTVVKPGRTVTTTAPTTATTPTTTTPSTSTQAAPTVTETVTTPAPTPSTTDTAPTTPDPAAPVNPVP